MFQTNQNKQDTSRVHFSGVTNALLQVIWKIRLLKDLQNCHHKKERTREKPLRGCIEFITALKTREETNILSLLLFKNVTCMVGENFKHKDEKREGKEKPQK